jgi:hypothetical protein
MLRGINGSGGGVPTSGSGAAGYLAKWTAATTLGGSTTTGATASPYVDATGNVGIGTTSPGASSKLAVVGGFIATAAGYGLYQPGDHLALNAGAGKNVYLKPNDGGLLAVNVGATSCDFTGVANYGLKLQSTPGNTDGQALDCYLDGGVTAGGVSWTPTIGGTAANWGGVLPVVASAKYSRIGNLVFCSVTLTGAALVTSYGNNTITGPLAAGPTVNTAVPVSGGGNNGVGVQAGNTIYLPTIAGATAEIRLNWFYAV